MKIHEFQAIALFREYGISTVECQLAETPSEAFAIAQKLGPELVVKAQVLVGGRGKAGGVRRATGATEAEKTAEEILSMRIKSMPVRNVLIAQAREIVKEYYLGITVDRTHKKMICMMSASGGMEIEDIARTNPGAITTVYLDYAHTPDNPQVQGALAQVFSGEHIEQARDTVIKMHRLFIEKDCSLVEINPYARISSGKLVALDAKINFDDNALFKHPELAKLRDPQEYSPQELQAQKAGLSFVSMEGDIGCIVNGAGLAMATMDMIKLFGAEPANFLDVGGSSNPNKVLEALRIILSHKKVKVILINIFGGITRCDDIANGIIMATQQIDISVPLVIRLIGTNEAEGRRILTGKGFLVAKKMSDAVKQVVEASKGV